MATRLKTVKYAFPNLASVTNATLTNFSQITLYLPENSKVFKSVVCKVTANDIITATGGTLNEWRVALRLGAAAYTTITNTNDITHTGENITFGLVQSFTGHFTSNWSGTSMTCDVQIYLDQSTGTTLNFVDATCELEITYEYDDSSATHVKTVEIPLNAPTGVLATSKPGSAIATIPALDTWLPENSKTFRSYYIRVQGNNAITGTSDMTFSMEIDTLGVLTSGNHEAQLGSDRFFTYIWNLTGAIPATNATHSFYIWASLAKFNHLQVTLVVTYEFTISGTTSVMNSMMIPFTVRDGSGGTSSATPQRATIELWVEEPATIAIAQSAMYLFWEQVGAQVGLNMRVNSASYVAYTDAATAVCGSVGCMYRCESAIDLKRGKSTITFDVYRSSTQFFTSGLCGYLLLNYTSGVSEDGIGAHNHSVSLVLKDYGTAVPALEWLISALAIEIPETSYFLNKVAFEIYSMLAAAPSGAALELNGQVERLSAEGGIKWEGGIRATYVSDPETGLRISYQDITDVFKQFPGDVRKGGDNIILPKIDIETSRRYRLYSHQQIANNFAYLAIVMAYHSITFSVADSVAGSGGGTVNLSLHRATGGERLIETSRVGNGAFSFTWYDNTENVYVDGYEDATHVGRSQPGNATGSP